ncbi:MAG: c-type cytochrome [Hyphomicrobium sp.]
MHFFENTQITPKPCSPKSYAARTSPVRRNFSLATAVFAALSGFEIGIANAADHLDGEAAFNNSCRTCHSVQPDDNRLGPHLNGIIGRASGKAAGFQYSSSLANGAIVWDDAKLDAFIATPDAVAPGNNMKPYTGIADETTRKSIIDFLKAKSAAKAE